MTHIIFKLIVPHFSVPSNLPSVRLLLSLASSLPVIFLLLLVFLSRWEDRDTMEKAAIERVCVCMCVYDRPDGPTTVIWNLIKFFLATARAHRLTKMILGRHLMCCSSLFIWLQKCSPVIYYNMEYIFLSVLENGGFCHLSSGSCLCPCLLFKSYLWSFQSLLARIVMNL